MLILGVMSEELLLRLLYVNPQYKDLPFLSF